MPPEMGFGDWPGCVLGPEAMGDVTLARGGFGSDQAATELGCDVTAESGPRELRAAPTVDGMTAAARSLVSWTLASSGLHSAPATALRVPHSSPARG